MEHEEFKKLYSDIESELSKRCWLIPRDKANRIIGACLVLGAVTVGTSWVTAYAIIRSSAVAQTTKEIETLRQKARIDADAIRNFRETEEGTNLALINKFIRIYPESGNAIAITFPQGKGRFQIEGFGKRLWYDAPERGGTPHELGGDLSQ